MTKLKFHVGIRAGNNPWIVFKSENVPTEETHGHLFLATIGPFRTKRGADYMAKYGRGNPHLQTVNDAEKLAKKEIS